MIGGFLSKRIPDGTLTVERILTGPYVLRWDELHSLWSVRCDDRGAMYFDPEDRELAEQICHALNREAAGEAVQ